MGYEIDFLPVGAESKGGDAIALRYGNLHGPRNEQRVIVVDGGFKESGELLVSHIAKYYRTDTIDVVVSTHPDQDHSSGLTVVLESCKVEQLWMHLPWNHSAGLSGLRQSRFATDKLPETVTASLQNASDLEEIAKSKGIPIIEPFTGVNLDDGVFTVVGPAETYYEHLLGEMVDGKASAGVSKSALDRLRAAKELLPESLLGETLSDAGETSPQNNSSAINLLAIDNRYSLLTGDAGIPALEQAVEQLTSVGIGPQSLGFAQVPHHGSRRNVGPTLLNQLLGPKGVDNKIGTAFVSSPKKNPEFKHPSKKVTNAFRRRGYPVHVTQGSKWWHHHNAPGRSDYSKADPLPLYTQVESDGDD